jgi:transglutaminase/protease-like cytokinesis protein 3
MGELVSVAMEAYDNEQDIAEFFYYWTASHIRYDRARSSGTQFHYQYKTDLIEEVMKSREAVCSGYAELFCEFLSRCNIPCEVINGFSKTRENILQGIPYSEDHSWNAISINEHWHLIDVTWANTTSRDGFIDDYYFMTEPGLFILDHYPTDPSWQLLPDPIPFDKFKQYPCYTKKYFQLGFGGYLGNVSKKTGQGTYQLKIGVSDGWQPVPVLVNKFDRKDHYLRYYIKPGPFSYYQTLEFSTRKSILRIDAVRKEKNYVITEYGIAYFDLDQIDL